MKIYIPLALLVIGCGSLAPPPVTVCEWGDCAYCCTRLTDEDVPLVSCVMYSCEYIHDREAQTYEIGHGNGTVADSLARENSGSTPDVSTI